MSLDTLLEAARYLEKIEQNGDVDRSGSSCSGSLSSSGDRSPGGYLRLDPNVPISSQFHDYSFPVNSSQEIGSPTARDRAIIDKNRHRKQTHVLLSPGKEGLGSKHEYYRNCASDGLNYPNSSAGVIVYPKTNAASHNFKHLSAGDSSSSFATSLRSVGNKLNSKLQDADATTRHRELHKNLEKNRRAHLRHCFDELRKELPKSEYCYKKSSHINIIHSATRYINILKKAEWRNEHEIQRLAKVKIRYQNQLAQLQDQLTGGSGMVSTMNKEVKIVNPSKPNENRDQTVQELIGVILNQAKSKAVQSYDPSNVGRSNQVSLDEDFEFEEDRHLMIEEFDDEDTESSFSAPGSSKAGRTRFDSCTSGCLNTTSMDSMIEEDEEDDDTTTASGGLDGVEISEVRGIVDES